MATMRRPLARRRTDLRWVFLLVGFFVFLFALTWERIAVKEMGGRIERLEARLQSLQTDEAMFRTDLKRECAFTEVREIASKEWGMEVAVPEQRVRLASARRDQVVEAGVIGQPRSMLDRASRIFRGGVAQAQSVGGEGGNGTRAR